VRFEKFGAMKIEEIKVGKLTLIIWKTLWQ